MKNQKATAMFAKVEEWENSGQTIRKFSADIGLSKSAFEYWIHKRRDALARTPHFVELVPEDKSSANASSTFENIKVQGKGQIELTFPGGLCIKVFF